MNVWGCARRGGMLALGVLLGGCVTYSPSQLAAMSVVDLCETREVQGSNLSPETRQVMSAELKRRNDDCRNHAAELAKRRDDVMYELVYGSPDDP